MRRFTLAQLEALLWIARFGSFQAAANKIGITRPTISLRIRDLENLLGEKVFHRRGTLELTPQGAVVLQYAERSFALFEEMADKLRTQDPLRGSLRLGSADMFAMTSLPMILRRLETLYPKLKIELTVDNSARLAELMIAQQLDIAFLNNPEPMKNIVFKVLGTLDVAWVSGVSQRVNKKILTPPDVVGKTIFYPPRPAPLSEKIIEWFMKSDLQPPSVNTCNNISVISRLLVNGNGMSVLPVNVIAQELQSGVLIRYKARPAFKPLTFCVAYQRLAHGPAIDAIIGTTREVIHQSGLTYAPVESG